MIRDICNGGGMPKVFIGLNQGLTKARDICNGGGMPKVFIGLNQGLTKAREEVVGTMNTVRCNHCSRYMS
jgi:hypothetical protein